MKRKIAAILAADVVGYSRLIAEDEEEAIRRLAAYRGVFDDFIVNHGGRIFNTAGDAVLAEFASSVEAVRCAVEVQESLRTRNSAFPPSRQMVFRIGITIADVVERDGDLLGDGVNIASRLEGLAEPGGICVSRAVYEQVANKLSVGFTDIGQQSVKNIPDPVHAFIIAASPDAAAAAARRRPGTVTKRSAVAMPAFVLSAVAAVAASGALAWVVFHPAPPVPSATPAPPLHGVVVAPVPSASPTPLASAPSSASEPRADAKDTKPSAGPAPAPEGPAAPPASGQTSPPPSPTASPTAGTTSPSSSAPGSTEPRAPVSEPATGGLFRNPAVEKPFDIRALPIVPLDLHAQVRSALAAATGRKALAVAANGRFAVGSSTTSAEDAARQAMEGCARHGTCRVVAVDDVFVVPIPRTVFVRGLFDPMTVDQISVADRPELARRLEASSGWSAVAIGRSGKPGVADGAANEADAITSAMADCGTRDSNCRLIALGPFRVERY